MKIVPCSGVIDHFIVDDEDYERVMEYNWRANKHETSLDGFSINTTAKNRILLKSFLFGSSRLKKFERVSGNKNDFRKINFFEWPNNGQRQGAKNKTKTTSKYVGVCLVKNSKKWRSTIKINREQKYLGSFTDEREAAEAYNTAALHYFGENAKLNIIE